MINPKEVTKEGMEFIVDVFKHAMIDEQETDSYSNEDQEQKDDDEFKEHLQELVETTWQAHLDGEGPNTLFDFIMSFTSPMISIRCAVQSNYMRRFMFTVQQVNKRFSFYKEFNEQVGWLSPGVKW